MEKLIRGKNEMIKRTTLRHAWMVVGLAVAWVGMAGALTDEERCLAGRAKAQAKYELCIGKWLARQYGGADLLDSHEVHIAKCRQKYAAAWTELQGLGTTCSVSRYTDNGNGTVTDNLTGLVWEKKSDNGDIHDKDTLQTWSTGAPYNGNGTAFTAFLTTGLNAAGFAGANDWRLPTFAELQTILLPDLWPCTTSPCVAPEFDASCTAGCDVTTCSCTLSNGYWSATTDARFPNEAWLVYFGDGFVIEDFKDTITRYARAVRGGL